MPPRKRISNIAKLLPRKRASTPEPTATTVPVHRDCTSLPAGLELERLQLGTDIHGEIRPNETTAVAVANVRTDLLALRVHRFAQRYESNQLPSYRDYPPVEEDESQPEHHVSNHSSLIHSSELDPESEQHREPGVQYSHICSSCDLASLRQELSLLRENHQLLSETTRETLRLAEFLEARVESLQRSARPSERLFWMLLDNLAAVVLFLFRLLMKPWVMARSRFVAERVRKRRSWRLSVEDFESDPFLGDVAKRLSFSTVDD